MEIIMADKTAPLFRKAIKGYKIEDVNNYILSLNTTIEENKKSYERALEGCNARAQADYERICELTAALKEQEEKCVSLETRLAELSKVEAELCDKEKALEEAVAENEALKARLAVSDSENDDHKAKADYYDSLCAKAGEILVIASNTAEDILRRANDEAVKIISDANNKKELLLKTLSESVDEAAGDINIYIKSAVDECIKRINASVKEVSEMAARPESKPKTVFVDEEQ